MIAEILTIYLLGAVGLFVGLRLTPPGAPWWRDWLIAALWPLVLVTGLVVVFEGPSEPGEDS